MRGAEKRRSFNELIDRLVMMIGVAMAVVGYGAGGQIGAMAGQAAGVYATARATASGRFRRGSRGPPTSIHERSAGRRAARVAGGRPPLPGMNADGAVTEYRSSRLRRPEPPALVRGAGFGTR